jgi:Spy/CpxP family protein refolding chaperone
MWKGFIALFAVMVLVAPAAQAQGGGGGGGRGGNRMMEMLFEGITLTDVQKAKVDSISTAFRAQMPQMTPGSPPDEAAMTKRREVMAKQQDALRAVLDPAQQAVYDKNVTAMRERMGRRPGS